MSMIDNYNEILESKRNNLVDFVCERISRISMPVVDDNTSTESTVSHSNSLPLALIVGGSVVFVAGIAISKSVVTSLGGIVALGGVAMKFASSKKRKDISSTNAPKYYQITNRIYAQLSDIQKFLFSEWKQTTEECKENLKNDIRSLRIEENKKNDAIQSVLTTSVINIPMMSVSSELSDIEKQKSIEAYSQYLQTFKNQCIQAIDKAVGDQKAIYEKINHFIN